MSWSNLKFVLFSVWFDLFFFLVHKWMMSWSNLKFVLFSVWFDLFFELGGVRHLGPRAVWALMASRAFLVFLFLVALCCLFVFFWIAELGCDHRRCAMQVLWASVPDGKNQLESLPLRSKRTFFLFPV